MLLTNTPGQSKGVINNDIMTIRLNVFMIPRLALAIMLHCLNCPSEEVYPRDSGQMLFISSPFPRHGSDLVLRDSQLVHWWQLGNVFRLY